MQIITIREAETAGLTHYFTGKPCKHGHIALRYVSTWRCVTCTVGRVLKWQRENPEKRSAKNRRYYENNPGKVLEHSRRDHKTARQRRTKARQEIAGRPMPMVCDVCSEPGRTKKIVFDHCHAHGHFRGWLCNRCNLILGHVNDSSELLRKLADYLDRSVEDGANRVHALVGLVKRDRIRMPDLRENYKG